MLPPKLPPDFVGRRGVSQKRSKLFENVQRWCAECVNGQTAGNCELVCRHPAALGLHAFLTRVKSGGFNIPEI